MTTVLKSALLYVHALKIDLAFQLALTLNCRTNIISKFGLEGVQFTDGRFQPTDDRFELTYEKMGIADLIKKILF